MPRLSTTIENVRKGWEAIPRDKRDQILANIATATNAMKTVTALLPMAFMEQLITLCKSTAQAAVMPFGPGLEGVLVEVAGVIPELSAYVLQLMGD